jgi:hypothetical protein
MVARSRNQISPPVEELGGLFAVRKRARQSYVRKAGEKVTAANGGSKAHLSIRLICYSGGSKEPTPKCRAPVRACSPLPGEMRKNPNSRQYRAGRCETHTGRIERQA